MRKVTAHLFSSLDGIVSAPHLFQFDAFGEEEGAAMGKALAPIDEAAMGKALAPIDEAVMGRIAYQEWADYWPSATDGGFEEFINPLRKHVATTTLSDPLTWENSSVIDGDLVDFVRTLKEGEGGEIMLVGISVIRQLFLAGLVDALSLTIHPVVAGTGTRLFPEGTDVTRLELIDSQITSLGNAMLTYRLKG